jgi:hypothetical protein
MRQAYALCRLSVVDRVGPKRNAFVAIGLCQCAWCRWVPGQHAMRIRGPQDSAFLHDRVLTNTTIAGGAENWQRRLSLD